MALWLVGVADWKERSDYVKEAFGFFLITHAAFIIIRLLLHSKRKGSDDEYPVKSLIEADVDEMVKLRNNAV